MEKYWTLKNLFKIHPITYLILISVLFSGYFNYFLVISFIILTHDLGHIIFLKFYRYQIYHITVLPFGSMIDSSINSNSPTVETLIISLAGIVFQLILFPIFKVLNLYIINDISYNIFLNYNYLIILFNLLPIIPLDGSKVLLCLLESFMSYKKVLRLINILSILGILLFIFYLAFNGLNSYLIIIFLLYKTYEEIKNHKYVFNQFLLNRYLSNNRYIKIKYINKITDIFKNRFNFIENQNEEKFLKAYYNR